MVFGCLHEWRGKRSPAFTAPSLCLDFRYSLSGIKPIPPPLISVDTSHSISSSAASDCGLPAVYGVPSHSRPASRYSNRSHRSHRSARHRSRSAHAAAAGGHGGHDGGIDRHGHMSLQPHSSSSAASTTHYSKYSNGRMIH